METFFYFYKNPLDWCEARFLWICALYIVCFGLCNRLQGQSLEEPGQF